MKAIKGLVAHVFIKKLINNAVSVPFAYCPILESFAAPLCVNWLMELFLEVSWGQLLSFHNFQRTLIIKLTDVFRFCSLILFLYSFFLAESCRWQRNYTSQFAIHKIFQENFLPNFFLIIFSPDNLVPPSVVLMSMVRWSKQFYQLVAG